MLREILQAQEVWIQPKDNYACLCNYIGIEYQELMKGTVGNCNIYCVKLSHTYNIV